MAKIKNNSAWHCNECNSKEKIIMNGLCQPCYFKKYKIEEDL